MGSLNPILGIVRRRQIIDRYKKERTIAKYIGTFSLKELRKNKKNGEYYNNLNINTELDLVFFLKSLGYGDYTVLGHKKGRHGWYVFWKGSINEDGWIFDTKKLLSRDEEKEINEYKEDFLRAETKGEENQLKLDIESVKKFAKEVNSSKKYGFYPYLIPSGKRGQINFWDMPSRLEEKEERDENGFYSEGLINEKIKQRETIPKSQFETMSLEEINGNFKEY
jgi:hypothetical protein